ncbi:unnamed protein product, partial [Staurois parvus]
MQASATYRCPLMLPISAHQCCLTVQICAAYQRHMSAAFQCPSVM